MAWEISGQYVETCSCDYLCPCITSNMTAPATRGYCKFVMAFRIDEGQFDGLPLDGLGFVLVAETPAVMSEGHWKVGLIVDAAASPRQREAIAAIASGKAGGPLASLSGLIGEFLGMEVRPMSIVGSGLTWSVEAGDLMSEGVEGTPSLAAPGQPVMLENTLHPANARLALARATHSRLEAFGISWEDRSGRNNGHFAPFRWRGDGASPTPPR